ncbi:MAG: aminotransferase, partial [Chloroflexota bacterium]
VQAIIARAHAVGALVVIDGYQAVGTLPVDVKALGVDFYVGGCVKWLCGGAGGGYLYVRPDLAAQLEPRLTGWMAHPRAFAFETEMAYRTD